MNFSDVVLNKLDLDGFLSRSERFLVDSLVFLLATLVLVSLLPLVDEETGTSTDGKDSEGPPYPGVRATSLLLVSSSGILRRCDIRFVSSYRGIGNRDI